MAVQMTPSPEQSPLQAQIRKRFASGFMLDVQLTAPPGITILFGASGAGKTTILDCISGLLKPDEGRIACGERLLYDSAGGVNVLVPQRRVGYVFQDLALFPHLTVAENVQYGLHGLDRPQRVRRAHAMLESFRIGHLAQRRPGQISGGERQRTALARALVTDPAVLLLDEPLAALDAPTKSRIMDDLRAWNDTHRLPILYVTHSREEVFALGERVVALEQGKLLAEGTPLQVLSAPRHEAIAQLAGCENLFDATVTALHEQQGTMTCELSGCHLEVPLGRIQVGQKVRVGIRAGDILLATAPPAGLSARNVLPGRITSLEQQDVTVIATVDCGVLAEVHLTPGARDALRLAVGQSVWLVIKTYSCHLLR